MTDNRFVSPELPPEGVERELLTILAEECCEVGQRVSKALRFGIWEVQPEQKLTNAERIEIELGDLIAVMKRLCDMDILCNDEIEFAEIKKYKKLEKYMQSQ